MLIEVWSDVVCPWCAIGRARLGRALDGLDGEQADQVEVRWRSFELDPNRPATTDVDYVTFLASKYGTSSDQAQAMIDRMTAAGAEDGIEFRFDIARPGNTFDAHRLIHLGADRGLQHEVKARFLDGYHSEGEPIADHDTLTRLAVETGLAEDEVVDVLAGDRYADEVRADEAQAYEYGISGVPFFVVDGAVGVSGAQTPEVLRAAVEQARDLRADQRTDDPGAGEVPDQHVRPGHPRHAHAPGEECVDGVCSVGRPAASQRDRRWPRRAGLRSRGGSTGGLVMDLHHPTHQVRVRYAEVDRQGVVFNAHWLTYADDAVTRFFEQLGYDPATLWEPAGGGPFDIMLRRSELDFAGPAHFDEVLDIEVHATRLGTSSFDLRIAATVGGRRTVTVSTTYVAVDHAEHRPIPMPDDLRERLTATLPSTPAST